eukprot:4869135-Heterocapsa_arctica.AAC.1
MVVEHEACVFNHRVDSDVGPPGLEDAGNSGKDEEAARAGSAKSNISLALPRAAEVLTGRPPND